MHTLICCHGVLKLELQGTRVLKEDRTGLTG